MDAEELRNLLDVEKFVQRLSLSSNFPIDHDWLVGRIREHDQAMFGATYYECPKCKCCWLRKPGDAAAARCSCCLVKARDQEEAVR